MSDSYADNQKRVPVHRFTIDPNDRLRSVCTSLDIEFVNVRPALRRASEAAATYVLFDYAHLNEDGHEVVAEALRKRIANE